MTATINNHMLDDHGTKLLQLKPVNIVQAAEEDLRRRERNVDPVACPTGYEHYAFHRHHVRKSSCPFDLLTLALRERQVGIESGKRWTRLIYRDQELLQAALEMVRTVPATAAAEPSTESVSG